MALKTMYCTTLDSGWKWKQRDTSITDITKELQLPHGTYKIDAETATKRSWLPVRTTPSEIHVELLKAGLIPDPHVGFNEHKFQCELSIFLLEYTTLDVTTGIGQVGWLYTCPLLDIDSTRKLAVLKFQGLDRLCDIYINGHLVRSVDNMFQTHALCIPKDVLKPSNNLLLLHPLQNWPRYRGGDG
ncbi:hypothetical protein VKT23_013921 [Stygiomarasmius scandens]|uniref:Beta-mannosidase-like galactose-binding domain-containing protein n=1 Tax=Marasmiellus scandens TaxID=2682957 RepID=A0ABR1J2S8_9AGAR